MGIERETIRFYTDVYEGFDPSSVVWHGIGPHSALPSSCAEGYKRIWIEIPMPRDSDLWSERFEGFHISGLGRNAGQRQLQVDLDRVETGQPRPEPEPVEVEAEDLRSRPRRRMSDGDSRSTI